MEREKILRSPGSGDIRMHDHCDQHLPFSVTCHVLKSLLKEFGLVTGFIENLYTQLVTTSNYNSLTGLHALKITVTEADIKCTMSSPVVSGNGS
jgi:hypothetical protein